MRGRGTSTVQNGASTTALFSIARQRPLLASAVRGAVLQGFATAFLKAAQ
jgi:hypothetical protein